MTYTLRDLKIDEFNRAIDLYISQFNSINYEIDRAVTLRLGRKTYLLGCFLKAIFIDDDIAALLWAVPMKMIFNNKRNLQQIAFCTNRTRKKGIQDIIDLHASLVDYAIEHNYETITSIAHPTDQTGVMARVLHKQGWEGEGHLAIKILRKNSHLI